MSLGIIVDDNIVVGEEILSLIQSGKPLLEAATTGTLAMLPPILSSSLTTISSFLPLMMVGGTIGDILFDIPLVVICVILASIIECFLILPNHLYKAMQQPSHFDQSAFHQRMNQRFQSFRDDYFRPFIQQALQQRAFALALTSCIFILAITLLRTGHVAFTFFPGSNNPVLYAKTKFNSGTSPATIKAFNQHVYAALLKTARHYQQDSPDLIRVAIQYLGMLNPTRNSQDIHEQRSQVMVELSPTNQRHVSNRTFIEAWKQQIHPIADVESFTVSSSRNGPPGRDLDIELFGNRASILKQATEELKAIVRDLPGTTNVEDDLPFGQEQLIFTPTAMGQALGLSATDLSQQMHAAFFGHLVQSFYEKRDEIDVRVRLHTAERNRQDILSYFPIFTAAGRAVPLSNVANFSIQRGIDILRHTDGVLSAHVVADVDARINNANQILKRLVTKDLPPILKRYQLHYHLKGRSEDQQETLRDMRYGLMLAFTLIYIILAWIFSHYAWPLLIIACIPLSLIGAIIGHWWLGLDLTILSLFGIFGLSGIVINDAIILVCRYRDLCTPGFSVTDTIVEAACQRLRPVMLTSITTIVGLTPLLFETSEEARFLIPMAVSIVFGLGFATVLILVVIPILLHYYETWATPRDQPGGCRPC